MNLTMNGCVNAERQDMKQFVSLKNAAGVEHMSQHKVSRDESTRASENATDAEQMSKHR